MTTLPQVVGRLKTKNSRVATSYPETLSLSDICSRVTVTDLATLVAYRLTHAEKADEHRL